jgi:uncharacterized protein with FMN-binding domain
MSAKKRGSINLTALGTAAVVAVYAAGYLRTQPAAQKHAGSDAQRRPVPTGVAAAPASSVLRKDSARVFVVPAKKATKKPTTVAVAKPKTSAAKVSTPVQSAPAPEPAAPVAAPVAAAPVVEQPKPAEVAKKWHDGTYSGWGSSRHGDIEAAVDIQDGRIVKAYITQCLTRYSCSRIAAIIPQVVERQSAEVDYVSGATQSTDAFYYAIVEALSKAKA